MSLVDFFFWCAGTMTLFGRIRTGLAGFGARVIPRVQQFGRALGRELHTGGLIGHTLASLARHGLNRLQNNPVVGRVPGLGEFMGAARDAANFVDMVSQGASKVGDVAEVVGNSNQLRGLTTRFEKAAARRS